jgi:ubiquinone/menaquinone biosynthesis C-methylase UbiE
LDFLVGFLRLSPRDSVVDIASGKGEFLIRLAEAYGIEGTGIDASPFCIADAEAKLAERVVDSKVEFRHLGGADYAPETPESLQMASCIGASWIWGGHEGTLAAEDAGLGDLRVSARRWF